MLTQRQKKICEILRRRGAWMDRHIDSLRQYAHSSRTEKYETR